MNTNIFPPEVPKVGQLIQIISKQGMRVVETVVTCRDMLKNKGIGIEFFIREDNQGFKSFLKYDFNKWVWVLTPTEEEEVTVIF